MKAYMEPKYEPITESSKPKLRELVESTNLNHILLVCDGNRRWARAQSFHSSDGHRRSFEYLMENIILDLIDLNINTITIWCYSTKNMQRSKTEVSNFMDCIEVMIKNLTPITMNSNIKVIHLGRKDRMSNSLRESVVEIERITENNNKYTLNLAMDYSGQDESLRAIRKLIAKNIDPKEVQIETIENELDTAGQRYPSIDLVIRPTGAMRLSGLMFWQSVYSELYFTKVLFPQFSGQVLEEAILDFGSRHRRFGL